MNGNVDKKHNAILREERRRVVTELYKSGVTSCRQISRELGRYENGRYAVTHKVVSFDILAIKAALKAEQIDNYADWQSLEIARCQDELRSIWPRVKSGDLNAIDVALKIQKRLADTTGSNAALRLESTGANGGPIDLQVTTNARDEFARRINGIAARLGTDSANGEPDGR